MWLAGLIFLVWAVYGYTVKYGKEIKWRNPIRWSIFLPYVLLYLATVMFYWFQFGIDLETVVVASNAGLFVISTILNVTSHQPAKH